ncbi:FMRFamide receptor [Schistosoma japonicum]|nr:FMRFamide receptor [Schistosoma japonicum]
MNNLTTTTTTTTVTSICHFTNPYEYGLAGILITHVSISLAILGIPANVLTLIVLKRDSSTSGTSTTVTTTTNMTISSSTITSSSRNSINFVLATLATEDILIIILYSLYYVAIHYYEKYHEQLVYLGLLKYADSPIYFLLSWIKVAEIYTIVLLSLQRYLAIRWPLRSAYLCSLGRTKRIIYGIFILSLLLKLPNLILGYRIMILDKQTDEQTSEQYCEQYILQEVFISKVWYRTFKIVYVQVVDQVITFIIPLSILIILNIGLILRVKQATIQRRLREDSCALILNKSTNKSFYDRSISDGKRSIHNKESQHLSMHGKQSSLSQIIHAPNTTSINSSNDHMSSNRKKIITNTSRSPSYSAVTTTYLHHHQAHNRSITLTLIGVISIFILCETPTTICFCYEFWELLTTEEINTDNNNTTLNSVSTLKASTEPDFYYYAYPAALLCILFGCTIGLKFRRMCIMYLNEVCTKIKYCIYTWCCCAKAKQYYHRKGEHVNRNDNNNNINSNEASLLSSGTASTIPSLKSSLSSSASSKIAPLLSWNKQNHTCWKHKAKNRQHIHRQHKDNKQQQQTEGK